MIEEGAISKFKYEEKFKKRVAKLFILIINDAIEKKGEAYVALSGGSTPVPVFRFIREKCLEKVDWEKVCFFWVDERPVPPESEESNYGNACEKLLNYLPGVKRYRMKGEYSPEQAAKEYEQYLKKVVPSKDGLPCFDLIWLGMGSDGHTASIFPNSEMINEKKDWVKSVWVEKLNSYRITLTLPIINNAKNRMIVMKGKEKLEVFNEIQKIKEKKYPIQFIQPSTAKDYWMIGVN
ncbi:6-phosphogluconolactonase [Fodinibius sp. AD559]|uniref:6-phosphogluconolactonase n=1 Tax=Fodinibius sp. AD559 TaxID=3424179 RepID=UPI00404696B9